LWRIVRAKIEKKGRKKSFFIALISVQFYPNFFFSKSISYLSVALFIKKEIEWGRKEIYTVKIVSQEPNMCQNIGWKLSKLSACELKGIEIIIATVI
jgi:hypothetical protein